MLEDNETKLQSLCQPLEDGEKSGFADYNYKSLISELDSEDY